MIVNWAHGSEFVRNWGFSKLVLTFVGLGERVTPTIPEAGHRNTNVILSPLRQLAASGPEVRLPRLSSTQTMSLDPLLLKFAAPVSLDGLPYFLIRSAASVS